jgi:hypothetical protein
MAVPAVVDANGGIGPEMEDSERARSKELLAFSALADK